MKLPERIPILRDRVRWAVWPCILGLHALFMLAIWLEPAVFSLTYLWAPHLIVLSSLLAGLRSGIISAAVLSVNSVTAILYREQEGAPWVTSSAPEFIQQLVWQLIAASALMILLGTIHERRREARERQLARQRILAIRHAHTGAIGELVGHMAHEVNNPLAILQGSVIRLRRQLERHDWSYEAGKLLTHMQHSHERIIRVQQALSVFASGHQHEPFVCSDVRSILRQVLIAMKPQVQAQQVAFEFKDHSEGAAFMCQPHQLVYVLCSLIQNALDACRDEPNPSISLDVHASESKLSLSVRDNGQGIAQAVQERIFQPFFTTKSGGNVQGLSLSVCRGILAEHGGAIHFTTRAGGTTFTCDIPRVQSGFSRLRKGA